ncbi:hypothetical protein [Flavobacterium glaciei]|uniref:Lipoprotein n=1 Tax=Flavobacterium glaciei TaxID=386300 RepID=A0A562PUJ2_9FLAO|nr:hypothetical protein [Flavobacterium glaciei]RDI56212.1 hypothetical protein DFR66_10578 [Flavobacterium glaciei]TWI48122.1 hypothetical protein IQ02_01278 [Flavobacterium glaciei]
MKYFTLIVLLSLFSCGNKEDILLPKASTTIVKNVADLSPIYIFFRTKGKDTLAEVNRKNSIISTNWILNVDKRLPLRLAIPEIMKLQQKKREDKAHKNEKAENYYSYADTIGKNLAFIPFTNVYYKLEKPIGTIIFFNKNNEILIENQVFKKEKLKDLINNVLPKDVATTFLFRFDKDLSFESYIQNKIFIESLKVEMKSNQEFIY